MLELIKLNTPIEIAFDKDEKLVYSGVCIKVNKSVIIIVNYDFKTNEYDGFTIFRYKDFVYYTLWEESEKKDIKNENFKQYNDLLNCENMDSFYSSLREASNHGLIAFFTDKFDKDYFVGKVLSISRSTVTFKIISNNRKWIGNETFQIKDISYFSFGTKYEKELVK